MNECWFVNRTIQVRLKYDLTIDQSEADAVDTILDGCSSVAMVYTERPNENPTPEPTPESEEEQDALDLYDDNGNGRISCEEARKHGIAPVHSDHPAYQYMTDRDGDGVVCE